MAGGRRALIATVVALAIAASVSVTAAHAAPPVEVRLRFDHRRWRGIAHLRGGQTLKAPELAAKRLV